MHGTWQKIWGRVKKANFARHWIPKIAGESAVVRENGGLTLFQHNITHCVQITATKEIL